MDIEEWQKTLHLQLSSHLTPPSPPPPSSPSSSVAAAEADAEAEAETLKEVAGKPREPTEPANPADPKPSRPPKPSSAQPKSYKKIYNMSLPAGLKESLDSTKVTYAQLGTSGLRISVPVLGGMSLGSSSWAPWVLDEEASLALLKAAYDRGLNTWDTANAYSNGASEEVMGKALRKFGIPRHKVVIMTKCFTHVGEQVGLHPAMFSREVNESKDYVNQGGLSRAAIFNAVDASLARLGTSYIDLLQIHRFDECTPPEETMRALHDLVQSGRVRYLGASSMWATQFATLQFVAQSNGWTRFVSMQNYWNLCYREEEREMVRFCRQTGVGVIPWSPLFSGRLARPLARGEGEGEGKEKEKAATTGDTDARRRLPGNPLDRDFGPADEEIIARVEQVARDRGWAMTHVALAWLRSKGAIPIVGCSSVARLDEACALRGKELTEDEAEFLEEPYVPKPVVGHS